MKKEKYITKDKDAYFRVRIRTPDGVFSKSINIADYPSEAKALAAAKIIRDQALADRHANRLVAKTPTVEVFFRMTFDLFGYSIKTWKKHEFLYENSISQFASKELDKVSAADILESVTEFAQTHTDGTVDRLISVWHSIFQAAQLKGYPVIDHSMAVRINRPSSKVVAREKAVTVSEEDLEHFLDVLSTYNHNSDRGRYTAEMVEMLIYTMIYTGCRPAEAMALTRADINLITREISINKSVGSTHTSEGREIRTTKTKQSRRNVPIADPLYDRLLSYLPSHPHDLLFCDTQGNPLEIDWLANYMRLVSKKAGVNVTLYMLRHKFSTDLLKTADLRTVQDLMGHESGAMTLSYARSSDEDRKKAIAGRKMS